MLSTSRRRVIATILLVQIVALAILVWTSSEVSDRAAQEQTERLLSSTVAVSTERINAYLEPAQSIVDLTTTLATSTDDGFVAEPLFEQAMRRSPQLAGVFTATSNGDFTFVSRTDDGFRHKRIEVESGVRTTTVRVVDADGALLDERPEPLDTFDPTNRPWFVDASNSPGELIWSDPYVFFTSGEIGVTAAKTILRDGEVVGVVGADIELASLSSFLRTLSLSQSAETVLTDQNGALLAHPDSSVLTVLDGGSPRPVTVSELQDEYTRDALAALLSEAGPEQAVVAFDSDEHGRSHVTAKTLEVGDDAWTISIFAPEDEVAAEVTTAQRSARNLILGIGVLTIALLCVVLYPAVREVRRLETRANTDVLTQLPNRRSILTRVAHLAARNTTIGLLMIDVDHFKQVNDTYGHQIGDDVLRMVSDRLAERLAPDCVVGRLGGEEFLVVLPGHHLIPSGKVAERLRQGVDSEPIQTSIGPIEVTISIGAVAGRSEDDGQDLLALADLALLHAKDSGRNIVVTMDSKGDTPSPAMDLI